MLHNLIALYNAFRCGDLDDAELCSLWDNWNIYVDSHNADYQIYDSLESFEPEEIATLGLAPDESLTWVMRDPWHTGGLIKFESVAGMIRDVERTMFGCTLAERMEVVIDDLIHDRIDANDATDFINSYAMEQYLPEFDEDDDDEEF